MLGTSDSRREQMWRNESKARYLLEQHGDAAFDYVRREISDAGFFNLRVRSHWRRVEWHLQQITRVKEVPTEN